MKKIKKGLIGAISGIVIGFVLIAVVNYLVQRGTIPEYWVWILGFLNFAANLLSLNSFRSAGLLYTLGWLGGSWIFIGMFGPTDILFNIAAPIAIMVLRVSFWIKKAVSA